MEARLYELLEQRIWISFLLPVYGYLLLTEEVGYGDFILFLFFPAMYQFKLVL